MKKWIILIAVLVAVAFGFAKFRTWRATLDNTAASQRLTNAVVEPRNIDFAITAAGDIGPADQVSVRPEINGKIEVLAVDIGDRVTKGSLLFKLDDRDLQTERSSRLTEIEGAKLSLERAQRNHTRAQQLFNEKLISQEMYDDTKTEYELAKNSLERADTALRIVADKLTKTAIQAPFDCTVLTRPVSIGQAVSGSGGFNSGTEVLTIANLNDMIVNAHINQADITRLKVGQEVDIEVEAVLGLTIRGQIERLAPQATVRNGIKGFATRIRLTQVDPRVRPGMTANLTLPIASVTNALAVPLAAVFSELGERFVYVKQGAEFEKCPIQIGLADFFYVEILSGLKTGDVVALEAPPTKPGEEAAKLAPQAGPLRPAGFASGTGGTNLPPRLGAKTTTNVTQTLPKAGGRS